MSVKVVLHVLLVLSIVLLNGMVADAQEHNYTQYTIEDGLPTNYVYGLVEDNRGYIWAYTEQGIARFDGYEWKAFGLSDGLGTLDCYSMCPLSDGSYLVGGNGWPTIVRGDSLFRFPIPQGVKEAELKKSLLNEGYPPLLTFSQRYSYEKIGHVLVHSADSTCLYTDVLKGFVEGFHTRLFKNEARKKEVEKEFGSIDIFSSPAYTFMGNQGEFRFAFWSTPEYYFLNDDFIGNKGAIEAIAFRGLVQNEILQVYADSVLYQYDSTFSEIVERIDLSSWYRNYDVNRVFRAESGDLWIATRSNGVLHIRSASQKVKNLSDQDGASVSIEGVTTMGNEVYIADDKSNLYKVIGGVVVSLKLDKVIENDSRFVLLRKEREGELVFQRGRKLLSITKGEVNIIDPFKGMNFSETEGCDFGTIITRDDQLLNDIHQLAAKGVVECNGFILVQSPGHIFRLNEDGKCLNVESTSKYVFDKRTLINKSEIFVGRTSDLFRISTSEFNAVWTSDSISISALYSMSDTTFLLGTRSNGVYRLSLGKEGLLEKLFSSKRVQTITRDPIGHYWAATYSGVYRFAESGEVELHLTQSNGLPSSETYDLDFFADSVALGTAKGLALFAQDLEIERGTKIPDRYVELQGVKVEGAYFANNREALDLNPEEDDLEIEFSLLHPGSEGDIAYDVQLQPYDREPIRQKTRTVRYPKLNAGNYIFTVKATAVDGSFYTLEQPLNIRVRAHLYKQAWFQLLFLLMIGGAVWFFIRWREKEKYKVASERTRNNRRISELQLEALRSQMNPHFVFNALGSIQYYIQSEEKELADSYLTKFAQLMRKYLDSSKRNLVTVGEEVSLLTQYLELEKMRFDHAFTFEFRIDDEVDESDPLPSMILQPFVENAIIHGLANRSEPGGEIIISISDDDGLTTVVVADNGIGMENSKKLKRRGHRSRATQITNERISALQNSGSAEIDLKYEVVNPNNLPCPGTKATLRINFQPDEN